MKKTVMLLLAIGLLFTACQSDIKEKKTEPIEIKETQQKQPFSKDFYKCDKERGETTIGIASCLEEEFNREDKRLNTAYKKAKESIQPFRRESLKKVQLAWIAYRDAKCGFLHHKESGSSGSLDEQECLIKETMIRAKELKDIF